MPSRPLPPSPSPNNGNFISKARALFIALTISASIVIFISLLYLLYHLWFSLLAHRSRTIPFDSTPPSKLHRFTYKELKLASNDFNASHIIGKGGSGTVFRGITNVGKLIAIKRLDALSLQTEREFQNELHILGGLRSPFLVPLLGYCVEKKNRILVYEYVPNRSLQEALFGDGDGHGRPALSWERRFGIVLDVAKALEFLHLGCDPPVIHGDIKPSNVLLDSDFHGRVSDFGLSRFKVEGEFGAEFFSQELSGTLAPSPVVESPNEIDFALALQVSSCKGVNFSSIGNEIESGDVFKVKEKGKEVLGGEDWNRFVPYEDDDHSKELNLSCSSVDKVMADSKQWGEDWWWRQDGSGELCSKDYVKEWIGSQIGPSTNPVWEEGKESFPEKISVENHHKPEETQLQEQGKKKNRKMQEWWKEEHLAEITKKGSKLKKLKPKLKKRFKIDLGFRFRKPKKPKNPDQDQEQDPDHDFSFRRGWRKRNNRSFGSAEMFSGDLLSSTTSMRGTLCYIAPEHGGSGYLIEKADIYSFGVLILVIVSGRRPLHVLASPMKLEKANLISWCRQLAHSGNVLELVDEKLRGEFSKEQAGLCINLALACLQKMPELRPEIGEIVKVLRGEMDLPATPFEFSPSPPPSRLYSRSRRKLKGNVE